MKGRTATFLRDTSCAVTIGFMSDVTDILGAMEQGDPHAAEHLLPLDYGKVAKLVPWGPG